MTLTELLGIDLTSTYLKTGTKLMKRHAEVSTNSPLGFDKKYKNLLHKVATLEKEYVMSSPDINTIYQPIDFIGIANTYGRPIKRAVVENQLKINKKLVGSLQLPVNKFLENLYLFYDEQGKKFETHIKKN